jgi:hypothetical protein
MDAEAQRIVETVVGIVGAFVIGLPMLLFGRRLFWLLGGLAMAVIGLAVAALVVFLVVLARYPTVLQALTDAAQTAEATQSSTIQLPSSVPLAEEASKALETAATQFGLLILLVGLIGGLIGALILIRLPRVASAIVGFVGGIYLLLLVFELYSVGLAGWLSALLAIAAGIFVAIIAWRNPDTSLIVLSTLIGANIIVLGLNFNLNTSFSAIVWLSLMLIGIIYQTNALRRRQVKTKAKAALAKK